MMYILLDGFHESDASISQNDALQAVLAEEAQG